MRCWGRSGGLYYWFRPEKRVEAREWLEAAVTMGARSQIIRLILERDRLVEMDRRKALDWFRSASARILRDPTVSGEMRRALVEELGRFQEFQPMLIDLQAKPEQAPEEPTIDMLRERARYLSQLVANVARGGQSERYQRLAEDSNRLHCLSHTARAGNADHLVPGASCFWRAGRYLDAVIGRPALGTGFSGGSHG